MTGPGARGEGEIMPAIDTRLVGLQRDDIPLRSEESDMPYINDVIADQLERMTSGKAPTFWRASHWGLFPDPEIDDDDPDRYAAAAEALTERVVAAAGVADGRRVADVGCGFGGTLDHIAVRNTGCRLVGLNIDERQLRQARKLLEVDGRAADPATPMVVADGCRLPLADTSIDHVLAIECVFHFPSRKAFFREAARVLEPGGTLALSDFVLASGSLRQVAANMAELPIGSFYGPSTKPLTSLSYARLARSVGLDLLIDEDITAATLPTYPALRRIYEELDLDDAARSITACEALARAGGWEYHVLAFRKRAPGDDGVVSP
jgi:SAM-dependent methyltransferase